LHQFAYEEEGFVHCIATYPDLIRVLGTQSMLNEVKKLLREKAELTFGYDTTFRIGQCYVSPLLFKHIDFHEEPVMPVLFLVHERKLTTHHAFLFKILRDYCGKLKGIPVLIDMELGIRNAIEEEIEMKIVGCWRHLRKDIEAWVSKHGGRSADRTVYMDNIYDLMRCTSEESYLD
jgi:hypothetical protein